MVWPLWEFRNCNLHKAHYTFFWWNIIIMIAVNFCGHRICCLNLFSSAWQFTVLFEEWRGEVGRTARSTVHGQGESHEVFFSNWVHKVCPAPFVRNPWAAFSSGGGQFQLNSAAIHHGDPWNLCGIYFIRTSTYIYIYLIIIAGVWSVYLLIIWLFFFLFRCTQE